jgi:TPR repeat protein
MRKILAAISIISTIAIADMSTSYSCGECYYDCTTSYIGPAGDLDRIGVKHYKVGKYPEAIMYHYRACIYGSASGCNHAGYMYDQGKGVLRDYRIARKYFTLSCNYGDGVGCSNLGVLYEEGQGVEQSDALAKRYYQKSCDLGLSVGCRNLDLLNRYLLLTK